jgi:hypothetical protein
LAGVGVEAAAAEGVRLLQSLIHFDEEHAAGAFEEQVAVVLSTMTLTFSISFVSHTGSGRRRVHLLALVFLVIRKKLEIVWKLFARLLPNMRNQTPKDASVFRIRDLALAFASNPPEFAPWMIWIV